LKISMKFSFPTLAFCIAGLLLVIGAFQGGLIKGTFFPNIQSDSFNVSVELPPGTREDQLYAVLDKIETAAYEINDEIKNEFYNGEEDMIELMETTMGPTTYQGNINFYLMDGENRPDFSNRLIVDKIRTRLGFVPEADQIIFNVSSFFGDPVSISLLGTDGEQLEKAVDAFKTELTKIKEIRDIQDSNKEGLKEISLELTPKALSLGFTLSSIMRYVRQGFFGAEIQRLQRGADEVKVWVRYAEEDRSSLKDLADMRIRTPNGQSIPLSDLANFTSDRGVISISHLDGQREIRVTADVESDKVSVSDVNADIQNIILPQVLSNFPSVKVGIQGQARDNAESAASMQTVMPLVLLCMFFVIVLTFSSVSQALIVFMLIPFGFIGVGFGHWIMSQPISLMSILGVVALVGIMVNDALVFISAFNTRIKNGEDFDTALYETGISRFRPITLTTVTTVAGLLPLILETSVQAQFLIPMAISVAFGLMITTFILLILIPSLMVISNRLKLFTTQLWTGETYTKAMVEPAYANRKHPWLLTLLAALIVLACVAGLIMMSLKISEIFV